MHILEENGFGWPTGLEPATSAFTEQRSNQLSYDHHQKLEILYHAIYTYPDVGKYFLDLPVHYYIEKAFNSPIPFSLLPEPRR